MPPLLNTKVLSQRPSESYDKFDCSKMVAKSKAPTCVKETKTQMVGGEKISDVVNSKEFVHAVLVFYVLIIYFMSTD